MHKGQTILIKLLLLELHVLDLLRNMALTHGVEGFVSLKLLQFSRYCFETCSKVRNIGWACA